MAWTPKSFANTVTGPGNGTNFPNTDLQGYVSTAYCEITFKDLPYKRPGGTGIGPGRDVAGGRLDRTMRGALSPSRAMSSGAVSPSEAGSHGVNMTTATELLLG